MDAKDAPAGEDAIAKPNDSLKIVGIGASAGGLEAIIELVKNAPPDAGAAFVVVQHLSPQHRSLLSTLISRETPLEVVELLEDSVPQPNVIYVTPPNHDILFQSGTLRLHPPSNEVAAPKPSVDRFFASIAGELAERAVGVVLSGTGSDGAYGVQAIRAAGGVTIAQDCETAKYDGMPMAATETGCIDLVLSPAQIGAHLHRILTSPRDIEELRLSSPNDKPLGDLLQIVLARTRVDFREYKPSTIQRRIERRMTAIGIHSIERYTHHCRTNESEVQALLKDLLISVTRFFRDPDEFEALKETIVQMVREKGKAPLRIWVAGCATGEEAYSIAMLVAEAMGGIDRISKENLQIFATDIDQNALAVARAARYSLAATYDVPEEYLSAYFVRSEDGVRISPVLRDVVMISMHNVCQDPPFINLDLVCCRNMMIYFSTALQKKVLRRIHYALRQGGLLFMGTAESVTSSPELFSSAADRAHIFRKRMLSGEAANRYTERGPRQALSAGENDASRRQLTVETQGEHDRSLFDALARALGPDAILVSSDMRILRVYGDMSAYISLTEHTRLNLSVTMLRGPLASEARSLAVLALRDRRARQGVPHSMAPRPDQLVQLEVLPLSGPMLDDGIALIVFKTHAKAHDPHPEVEIDDSNVSRRMRLLENELETTREALQQTVEELETSNEELQSLNEELQSTNEELQAANEELETANEELQSTNEELVTVNEELEVNASELQATTDDLHSILENIPTPVVTVDVSLQITRASEAATELFSIARPSDRPHLSQVAAPSGYPRLPDLCAECLKLGKTIIREFESLGETVSLRCAPYSDARGRMAGVALVFMTSDIASRIKRELDSFVAATPHLMMQRDRDGVVIRVSDSKARLLGKTRDEIIGKSYRDLVDPETAERALRHDRAFLDGDEAQSLLEEELRLNGERHWLMVNRIRHLERNEIGETVYTVESDTTRRHVEGALSQDIEPMLGFLADELDSGWWSLDPLKGSIELSDRSYQLLGVDPDTFHPSVESLLALIHKEDRAHLTAMINAATHGETPKPMRYRLKADGSWLRSVIRPHGEGSERRILGLTMRAEPDV